jgi:RNA polymerase sigma-70 factor, ECF subfamily
MQADAAGQERRCPITVLPDSIFLPSQIICRERGCWAGWDGVEFGRRRRNRGTEPKGLKARENRELTWSGLLLGILGAYSSESIRRFGNRQIQSQNSSASVNSCWMRASTRVMAAGTALEAITTATADRCAVQRMEAVAQEFSGIVQAHRPQIFRFLLASTRDVDLAETLTQECFLKAHRNWESFRGESSVMTWLMRIAINLEKDHWRNRRVQFWRQARTNSVDVDEASEWLPNGERTAEQQLLAREQVKHVWSAVKGLSARQRTVFLLRYVEEQELSEIAHATGLSEGTVKAHLSRALAKVRAELRGTK